MKGVNPYIEHIWQEVLSAQPGKTWRFRCASRTEADSLRMMFIRARQATRELLEHPVLVRRERVYRTLHDGDGYAENGPELYDVVLEIAEPARPVPEEGGTQ